MHIHSFSFINEIMMEIQPYNLHLHTVPFIKHRKIQKLNFLHFLPEVKPHCIPEGEDFFFPFFTRNTTVLKERGKK